MDRSILPPLRSLPRVFVLDAGPEEPIELPSEEVEKLRKVLRLPEGAPIAVLPGDGSLIRCEFRARKAWPRGVEWPQTEAPHRVTLAQALPKGDRIETVIRMCTEIGVAEYLLFEADRSVVKWDEGKRRERLRRLQAIAREAAEQSFRVMVPPISFEKDLAAILSARPDALVLSEVQSVRTGLEYSGERFETTLVVGPEGGWSPAELQLIGKRAVTLGPRVLRADTAGPAAAAMLLLG